MGKIVRAFINLICILLALVILAGGGLITYLTVQEYRPRDQEALTAAGTARDSLSAGDSVSVISWNIGYGGLSKTADFFMDGGVSVRSQPSDQVRANIEAVSRQLADTETGIRTGASATTRPPWWSMPCRITRSALPAISGSPLSRIRSRPSGRWIPGS